MNFSIINKAVLQEKPILRQDSQTRRMDQSAHGDNFSAMATPLPSTTEDDEFHPRGLYQYALAAALAAVIGMTISAYLIDILYATRTDTQWPSIPQDVAIRQLQQSELLLMWEPPAQGSVIHYRITRWNPLLSKWIELAGSPTPKLGILDSFLPDVRGSQLRLRYQIIAENRVNRSVPATIWHQIGYPNLHFDAPSSFRAPDIPQTPLRLIDTSFRSGEERIQISWDHPAPPEEILGYQVYFYNQILDQYDLIEQYDSTRNHTYFPTPNFPAQTNYCFAIKSVAWGDIGISAPSFPRCLYISEWLWQQKEEKEETPSPLDQSPSHQQFSHWKKLYS